jgi:TrmH family RNA methyltransferase
MISKNQIKLVRSLEHKKHRIAEGLFVAEGPKVTDDLLACHFRPRIIFTVTGSERWEVRGEKSDSLPIQIVTDDELRRISFLQHPQQVLAVFELPATNNTSEERLKTNQLSLALDSVQDPGNLGTIIRVADWYGIDTIYCSADTADAWSPKVVQATMGSIARVKVVYTDLTRLLRDAAVPVYGTVLDGDNIYRQQLATEGVIVMGNEGNGISAPVRSLLTHRLLIPQMRPGAESLNVAVATAIVCSEFRRATQL